MDFTTLSFVALVLAVIALTVEVQRLKRGKPAMRAPLCGSEITWRLRAVGWSYWDAERAINRWKDAK